MESAAITYDHFPIKKKHNLAWIYYQNLITSSAYFIPANSSCCGPMWNTPLLSPDVLAIFTVCVKLSMFLRCRARWAFPERRISLKLWVWLFGGSYSHVWKLCSPRWMSPRMPYSMFVAHGVHKLWLSTTSLSASNIWGITSYMITYMNLKVAAA